MGLGMEIDQWEWDGILIVFPHTSSSKDALTACAASIF